MAKSLFYNLIFFLGTSVIFSQDGQAPGGQLQPVTRRFQYKHSFKGPQLANHDGQVPFWLVEGDAIAGDDSLRVVPSLKSKRGRASCKTDVTFRHWQVDLVFRITGRGRLGADGLAFWYTTGPLSDGTVFGAADRWQGLSVIFDSYDNDGLQNNPMIMGIVNDGTKEYDHRNDGGRQGVGQCVRDFRNKPYPVRTRIIYLDNVLTVFISPGLAQPDPKDPNAGYEMCFRAENVYLPMPGRFGISAATGGLADDHDVLAFLTHELSRGDAPPPIPDGGMSEDERLKLSQKYDKMTEEVEKLREDYRKEHPGAVDDLDEDDGGEDWAQRELRNIYQSLTLVLRSVQKVDRKLDEMYGRQEQLTRSIYSMSQGGQGQQQGMPQQQQQQLGIGGDGMKRHEVDQMMNTQRELVNELSQMKATVLGVSQMQQQLQQIAQQQAVQSGGAAAAGGANTQQIAAGMMEVRDSVVGVRRVVDQLASRPIPSSGNQPFACPVPNCLSPTYFIIFVIAQFCMFIGYALMRSRHEKPKFY